MRIIVWSDRSAVSRPGRSSGFSPRRCVRAESSPRAARTSIFLVSRLLHHPPRPSVPSLRFSHTLITASSPSFSPPTILSFSVCSSNGGRSISWWSVMRTSRLSRWCARWVSLSVIITVTKSMRRNGDLVFCVLARRKLLMSARCAIYRASWTKSLRSRQNYESATVSRQFEKCYFRDLFWRQTIIVSYLRKESCCYLYVCRKHCQLLRSEELMNDRVMGRTGYTCIRHVFCSLNVLIWVCRRLSFYNCFYNCYFFS